MYELDHALNILLPQVVFDADDKNRAARQLDQVRNAVSALERLIHAPGAKPDSANGLGMHICGFAGSAHQREQDELARELFLLGLRLVTLPEGRSTALRHFADALIVQGDYRAAHAALEESVLLARANGNIRLIGDAEAQFGRFLHFLGDCQDAEHYLEAALDRRVSLDEEDEQSRNHEMLLRSLGYLYIDMRKYGQARVMFDRSQGIACANNEPTTAADSGRGLAMIKLRSGKLAAARQGFLDSVIPWKALGHARWQSVYAIHQTEVSFYADEREEALRWIAEAERHAAITNAGPSETMAGYWRGRLATRQGDKKAALAHHRANIASQRRRGGKRHLILSVEAIAEALTGKDTAFAAELFAAADAARDSCRMPVPPVEEPLRAAAVARVRDRLTDVVWQASCERGRTAALASVCESVVNHLTV